MQIVHKENKTLDMFRLLACIMITAAHLPSVFASELTDFYYRQWCFRFCVPFFFICSGYFFERARDKGRSLKRIGWLFALSYVLYLPAILGRAEAPSDVLSVLRWNLVFGYEHLWYLSAVLEGMFVWYLLEKIPVVSKLFHRFGIPASFLLLLLGALLDEHYHLINSPLLQTLGDFLLAFGGPRNVVFMGFPLMMLGGAVSRYETKLQKIPALVLIAAWVVFRALGYWECTYLFENLGEAVTNDITFFGCLPALALFLLSFRFQLPIPEGFAKLLRRMTEYIYILHPLMADLVYKYLELEQPWLLISTVAMSAVLYVLLEKQFVYKK